MTNIDISALEKALSSKGRQPKKDLSPKPGLSKRALLDEAIKLAEDVNSIYSRNLRTRHAGESYSIQYGDLHSGGYRRTDKIEDIPCQVFEQLVANGRRLLKDYHGMIDQVIQLNPELALEANLEGQTGSDVLRFAYDRRIEQIGKLLSSRVVSPEVSLSLQFKDLVIKAPLGKEFEISIDYWIGRSVTVGGVSLYSRKRDDMIRLAQFLTYFEQVETEINRQLDTIEIKKEVTR